MRLFVESNNGLLVREIASAMPLDDSIEGGPAAEAATLSSVERWGMPDFVFRPVVRSKGNALREISDGLVVQHDKGLVIQVKHRSCPGEAPEREERWVNKVAAKASRQVSGTVCSLQAAPTAMLNLRGRKITIPDSVVWIGVIILDHPAPPPCTPELSDATPVSVILLRRDWEFLFQHLKGTRAVVDYLHRIADQPPVPLGEEPTRYFQTALRDDDATPGLLDRGILGEGEAVSEPILPLSATGHDGSLQLAFLRQVMEDFSLAPIEGETREEDRLLVLSELDTLPIGQRVALGSLLVTMLQEVGEVAPGEVLWRFRRFLLKPPSPHLAFGACSKLTPMTQEAFSQWVMLRHFEHCQAAGTTSLASVAVLLTPRHDGRRPWDTTVVSVRGDLEFTEEELSSFREPWSAQ